MGGFVQFFRQTDTVHGKAREMGGIGSFVYLSLLINSI